MGTQRAYTLSELLVAIAILGLLATFAIPKLLQDVQTQQNKAKFKETLSMLEAVGYEAYLTGQSTASRLDYFAARLNAAKVCMGNAVTQGCINSVPPSEVSQAAFVFHNGVVLGGVALNSQTPNDQFQENDGWFIDVNGSDGPNEAGQDIMQLIAPRFEGNTFTGSGCGGRRLLCPNNSASITLYNSLW